MKTLTKIALLIVALTAAASAKAQMVRGHFRSNGTYVAPYYRTPANGIPYDNLSYRGYPSQQPGYISPRKYSFDTGFSDFTPRSRRNFDTGLGNFGASGSYTLKDNFTLHSPFSWDTGLLSGRSSGFGRFWIPSLTDSNLDW